MVSPNDHFFDVGVVATLQGRRYRQGTPEFGEAFATYIMHELQSYRDYLGEEPLSYWRSTSGIEVDFILGDHTAIVVKARTHVPMQELRPLLAEEHAFKRSICVSLEPSPRRVSGITVLPYQEFLKRLWEGEYC